jgi:hypothetical protein
MSTVAAVAILCWCAGAITAAASGTLCDSQRLAVATLRDKPRLLPVRTTTLAQLSKLPKPSRLSQARLADERRVYQLTVQVIRVQKETDGVRLVLSDGAGHTMIAKAPGCTTGATAAHRRQMAKARAAIRVCSDAVLVGVLFHTRRHERSGAPNGVELEPLLSFECVAPAIPFGH